ncbi:MAG: caspase family protein, partial [Gemmatimonadaceae bacterium]
MVGKRRALLIGVGDYDNNGLPALETPPNDIKGLAKLFKDADRCRFDEVDVLPNPRSQEFRERAERLFSNAGRDDLVVFYFSGHGRLHSNGSLLLCATNSSDLSSTTLPLKELNGFIEQQPIAQVVIILDCCFSGAAGASLKGDVKSVLMTGFGTGQGKYIIASSAAIQVSRAQPGEKYSLFTKWLIEGLQTGAPDINEDRAITVEELFLWAKERTTREVPEQEPQHFSHSIKPGDVVIGFTKRTGAVSSSSKLVSTHPSFFGSVRKFLAARGIIPFLGDGIYGNGPLNAHHVMTALATAADLKEPVDIPTTAEYCQQLWEDRGVFVQSFTDIIREQSAEVKSIAAHALVINTRPRLVISATYDLILEKRLEEHGVPFTLLSHVLQSEQSEEDGKLLVIRPGRAEPEVCVADKFLMPDPKSDELVIYKPLGSPLLSDYLGARALDALAVTESDLLTF